MNKNHLILRFLLILSIIWLSGCSFKLPDLTQWIDQEPKVDPSTGLPVTTPLPPPSETLVTFVVNLPANTPAGEPVFLTILDEVTGLALNSQRVEMQPLDPQAENPGSGQPRIYLTTHPFAIGSVVTYRYERQTSSIQVGEHTSDGAPVRYRIFHVEGQSTVEDTVSRWTDTVFDGETGRLSGLVVDAETEEPIPKILIAAGGFQTFTTADGAFMLEGLPPGVHNLVGYALDGAYRTFQQGAQVAAGATTPANLAMELASQVKMVFVVRTPANTPPAIPLRLAGNLYQLGNSFGTLNGGVSSVAANMPVLGTLPDGRYTITLELPAGSDLRYKYTLGDGFWNAEYNTNGSFRLRQVIIPEQTGLIEDQIETWSVGPDKHIAFDITVPANTPIQDSVSIQFNPIFGWTEPIPMWPIGANRWAYSLFGPLNLPGNLSYRVCRNDQCGVADDVQTPGLYGAGRAIQALDQPQTITLVVDSWVGAPSLAGSAAIPPGEPAGRGEDFWAGVEFTPDYHPSWRDRLPIAINQVSEMGANWLVLTPSWSYSQSSLEAGLPLLAPVAGADPLWPDLMTMLDQAQSLGLNIAIKPTPQFTEPLQDWWLAAARNENWWNVWFEQTRTFYLHHLDLAAQMGIPAVILGGEWLEPALPGGILVDGSSSNPPANAADRWAALLAEARNHYSGQILWSISMDRIANPPAILSMVDMVYLNLTVQANSPSLIDDFNRLLNEEIAPARGNLNKPFILAVEVPANPEAGAQMAAYNILLNLFNPHFELSGFVSTGFYPPVAVQDLSASVNGKPATDLLKFWYSGWLNQAAQP